MRTLAFVLALTVVACTSEPRPAATPPATAATAAPPATAATARATYGKVTDGPTLTPTAILAGLDGYAGTPVRVEGTASGVCEKRGCWMEVKGDDGASIRVKVVDGEVVFPTTALGKRVIAEGVVVKIPADPATDPATCGGDDHHAAGEAEHEECARPAGASARIDGVGAVVFDAA